MCTVPLCSHNSGHQMDSKLCLLLQNENKNYKLNICKVKANIVIYFHICSGTISNIYNSQTPINADAAVVWTVNCEFHVGRNWKSTTTILPKSFGWLLFSTTTLIACWKMGIYSYSVYMSFNLRVCFRIISRIAEINVVLCRYFPLCGQSLK